VFSRFLRGLVCFRHGFLPLVGGTLS
jgi:hypothetical protein